MIIQDLLPTDTTKPCDGGTCEFSNVFYYINTMGTKYPAYCLGYISKDNLPLTMRANKCTFEDGIATFTDNTADANFPCGYIAENEYYSYLDGSLQQNNTNPPNFGDYYWYLGRFINQMYPEYVGMARGATVYATFIMYSPGTDDYDGTVYDTLGFSTAANLWSFLKYPDTTFTKTFGSTYGSFDFCARDFENNTDNYFETTTGYHVRAFITQISFGVMYRYYNGTTYDIALPFFANVSFKESIKYSSSLDVSSIIVTNTANPNYNQYDSGFAVYENGAINYSHFYGCGVMPSGATGTINVDGFIANHGVPWVYDGDILAHYRSGKIYFKCIRRPSEIMRQYSLFMRVLPNGGYNTGYSLGIYATDVTSNDEFLAQLKTGDIRDPDFKNGLRPWQYEDFQSDEFDPDDIPPYQPTPPTPPRPEPDPPTDEENGGDDILPPSTLGVGATMGFVTQYCLNASQISELGALLWTSFTDPDYWKNYMFSLALDTGSFNTSALLDYFVSLRVYPFPLLNVPSYAAWGQDMYVGTGVVPLHFTTSLHCINTFADWVDAGSCSIPFTFGDFRDYNQEITLYLPFCGTVQLEPADVLGGTISAKYAVDFSSGACTAVVMIETWDGHNYPIAILPGQIGADVPLTATTAGQVAARLGSDVLNVAGILLDGAKGAAGAVAPMVAGAATENPAMIATGAAQMAGNNVNTVAGLAGQALNMATRPGIGAPMLSGGRGFSSFGCPQKCYVQIRRPFYDEPTNYESTEGHPAAEQVIVSSCLGLARFVNPNVASIEAMEEEKEEIRRRLATGVII